MSQTLTLELPDEVYEAVKRTAEATGKTAAEWLVKDLGQRFGVRDGSEERDRPPARQERRSDVYRFFEEIAPTMGKTADELLAELRAKHAPKPRPPLTEEESQAAWERLRRHCGAANSGDPRSADNERIDEDLAREYGSTHEEG
jgi:hypothetical protein